ncbi:MAG TPA: phosphopantetheine-binding protein [Pirellulales bacterium]|jgi:acyl carrier protein
MTISSRTPEGEPNRCPICGKDCTIEPSWPSGDAPCPRCGHLLWWFQEHLSGPLATEREAVTADFRIDDGGRDSLEMVELVMELEEEFDINIAEEDAQNIQTIGDAIRYIESRRNKDS